MRKVLLNTFQFFLLNGIFYFDQWVKENQWSNQVERIRFLFYDKLIFITGIFPSGSKLKATLWRCLKSGIHRAKFNYACIGRCQYTVFVSNVRQWGMNYPLLTTRKNTLLKLFRVLGQVSISNISDMAPISRKRVLLLLFLISGKCFKTKKNVSAHNNEESIISIMCDIVVQ